MYVRVYRECGWPNNFNGTQFDLLRNRFEDADFSDYGEEEALER
jgi:hypothetical protein